MKRWIAAQVAGCAAVVLALSTCGCAAWKTAEPAPGAPRLGEEEQHRLVDQYEARRNDLQCQAAVDAWKRGDISACEAALREVLSRDDGHAEARRLLADLHLERGDAAASERELRELLARYPDDPAGHLSLAMLLESTGRGDEAMEHFAQAERFSDSTGR